MKYINYTNEELYDIQNRTREISSDPYKLFVALVLSALSEALEDSDDDDEEDAERTKREIIGAEIDAKYAKDTLSECIEDFTEAVKNRLQVNVGNASYTIRNAASIDTDRLEDVFVLAEKDGLAKITPDCINNLSVDITGDVRTQASDRLSYFRKIVMLADSTDDGFDKLTDMEAAVYCWGLFLSKHITTPIGAFLYHEFWEKYKDYHGCEFKDVIKCLMDGKNIPDSYGSFDPVKIAIWNKRNNQKSVVNSVDSDEADNFWYDVALKHRFKEK